MLRMRNRFKNVYHYNVGCPHCNSVLTYSIEGYRETVTHVVPWCNEFREYMDRVKATQADDPSIEFHNAIIDPKNNGTTIIAGSQSPSDLISTIKGVPTTLPCPKCFNQLERLAGNAFICRACNTGINPKTS